MITILDHTFSQLNEFIYQLNPSKLFILCDENTHEYCLPILLPNMEINCPFEIIEIEAGEEMKTIETATQLWEILTEFEADRKALLLNLGGGVITDLGGFVASTYKRGIKFINLPTSLLGMCDASIGGKTGIDHQFIKNIVGTFALPERIFVFSNFLKTLPFRELKSGFAEMIKHGLIADKKHWGDLINLPEISVEHIQPHIETSMKIKENIVHIDYQEKNIRKVLNFGHTIGHAVESLFLEEDEIVPHGFAIAYGMICETQLSYLEGFISKNTTEKIINNIRKFYTDIKLPFNKDKIIIKMMNDKKNTHGNINFTLLSEIGEGIYDVQCKDENILSCIL